MKKHPLPTTTIGQMIPHRYPFLFVDRVISCTDKKIVGLKNVSINEWYFQGHFPNNPVVPGVLLLEGLAQTAAIFGYLNELLKDSNCYLTEIIKARFRKQAVPGDVLHYHGTLVNQRKSFFWFEGEVHIGNEIVAKAQLSAYME